MAKRNGKKKKHGFLIGTILYAVIFLAITAVGLKLFWKYIAEYEDTRPIKTAQAYVDNLTDAHIREMSSDFMATLNHDVQSDDDIFEVISAYVDKGISFAEIVSECSDEKMVYMLISNGKQIGRFEMQPQTVGEYGFKYWEVVSEEMSFPMLKNSAQITVPADYSAEINGNILGDEYIVNDRVEYDLCRGMYENNYVELPYLKTYCVDNYIGNYEMKVVDPAGQTVEQGDIKSEDLLLDNLSESEQEDILDFLDDYVYFYVRFASGAEGDNLVNYFNLRHYLLPGSMLEERMYKAVGGQNYTSSKSDIIVDTMVNSWMKVAENYYLVDYTYLVDSTQYGESESVRTHNQIKLLIVNDNNYGYRAATLVSVLVEAVDK